MTIEQLAERIVRDHLDPEQVPSFVFADLRQSIQAAIAAEREACAATLDALADTTGGWAEQDGPESIAALKCSTYRNGAAAIRARS